MVENVRFPAKAGSLYGESVRRYSIPLTYPRFSFTLLPAGSSRTRYRGMGMFRERRCVS